MKRYHTNQHKDGVKITPHTKGCLTALRLIAPPGSTWVGPDDENKDELIVPADVAASLTAQLDAQGYGK